MSEAIKEPLTNRRMSFKGRKTHHRTNQISKLNSLTLPSDKDLVIKASDLQKILVYLKNQAEQEERIIATEKKLGSLDWDKLTNALNSIANSERENEKAEQQRFRDEQERFREEK